MMKDLDLTEKSFIQIIMLWLVFIGTIIFYITTQL